VTILNYQSKLGIATNTMSGDDQFNDNHIIKLQDNINDYVTNLKVTKVEIKLEKIKKLLPLYECQIKIDSDKPDKLFIKVILQQYVLEMIFKFANECFFYPVGEDYCLKLDVVKKTDELYNLMKMFTNTYKENDIITKFTPIKLCQLIYTALGMKDFENISESNESSISNTYKSIINFAKKLNDLMNTVLDISI
jgi:hypothetical protein